MLAAGIVSRPVYPGLVADTKAKSNLIVCEGEGARAVLDLAAKAPEEFLKRASILFCPLDDKSLASQLEALPANALWVLPTAETVLFRLKVILSTSFMGTRIYAAGTEPFIASIVREAAAAGVDVKSVFTEHRGSAKRRVQCVHCKGMTDNVTTNPVICSHCGLNLFVRDHFSRRLGAFQGVCIDAEVPGEAPAPKEIYK